LFAPILFRLPPDGRRIRVLALAPSVTTPGDVARPSTLGDDALSTKRTDKLIDDSALDLQVLHEAQRGRRRVQELGEFSLAGLAARMLSSACPGKVETGFPTKDMRQRKKRGREPEADGRLPEATVGSIL